MQHCVQYCAQCCRSRSKFYFCNISRNNCTVCPPHCTQCCTQCKVNLETLLVSSLLINASGGPGPCCRARVCLLCAFAVLAVCWYLLGFSTRSSMARQTRNSRGKGELVKWYSKVHIVFVARINHIKGHSIFSPWLTLFCWQLNAPLGKNGLGWKQQTILLISDVTITQHNTIQHNRDVTYCTPITTSVILKYSSQWLK